MLLTLNYNLHHVHDPLQYINLADIRSTSIHFAVVVDPLQFFVSLYILSNTSCCRPQIYNLQRVDDPLQYTGNYDARKCVRVATSSSERC
jgi:hypothetical protein